MSREQFDASDFERFSEAVLPVHAAGDVDALMRATLDAVRALLDGDCCMVGVCDPKRTAVVGLMSPSNLPLRKYAKQLAMHSHESPLLKYWQQTADHDRVLRRSDCVDETAFRSTALFTDFFRPLRLGPQLGGWCRPGGGVHLEVGVYRTGSLDFDRHDVARFATLRKHFAAAFAKLVRTRGTLPITPADDTIDLHSTRLTAGLDDAPRPAIGLTAREREVLCWLAEGKTNAEIGLILGIGWRTVQKHVENILRKLNVETRTAAALWAVRAGIE